MKDKLRVILFGGLLFGLSVFNILSPTKTFSDRENRFLEKFPEINLDRIKSGKFNEEFQKHSSDQFIFRDDWISLKTRIDLMGFKKDNGRVYFGKNDYLFGVEEPLDEKRFLKNMEKINTFKSEVNFPVDIMLIPTKATVLGDKLPPKAPILDEEILFKQIQSKLDKEINLVSLISSLRLKNKEAIYYKTDHHYTSLGAFYSYNEYMKSIGEKPYPIDYFKREGVTDKFLGSLFRKSNYYGGESEKIEKFIPTKNVDLNIIKNEKDKLKGLYDESFLEKGDKYSFFLGADHPVLDIKTSMEGKGTLLLVKDSFANSLIPFLTLHFDRITVIDERYFNIPLKDYIEDKEIDRVLFLYNIRTFADK